MYTEILHNMFLGFLLVGATGFVYLTFKAVRANTRFSRRGVLRFWRIGRLQVSWCITSRGVVR